MQKQLRSIILLLSLTFVTFFSFAQTNQKNKLLQRGNNNLEYVGYKDNVKAPLSKDELKKISEVFGNQTQALVLDNTSYLKDLKNLLRNRIIVFKIDDSTKQKKVALLSLIPLNKTYTSSVSRDKVFNKDTFNPLKYQLDFFSNGTYLYRVDNTDYFIKVTSQFRN